MKILNAELNVDILDADNAERFENAMREVTGKTDEVQKNSDKQPLSKLIRAQCSAIADCFDAVFGPGTAVQVFEGTANLKDAMKAFEQLITGVKAQESEITALAATLSAKGRKK